jgi:hypothetical protein
MRPEIPGHFRSLPLRRSKLTYELQEPGNDIVQAEEKIALKLCTPLGNRVSCRLLVRAPSRPFGHHARLVTVYLTPWSRCHSSCL